MAEDPWIDSRPEFKTELNPETRGRHAAHALLYSKSSAVLFESIPMLHAVMMQLRFDGTLGFPGGYVNECENITKGLNRELHEEIGLEKKNYFNDDDYFGTWEHNYMVPPLIDHFYVKQFSESDFKNIETRALKAKDWGGETMGIIRVPLDCYQQTNKPHGPFSEFLLHNYVGNAREQLVRALLGNNVLCLEDVKYAWQKMEQLKAHR